MKMRHKRLLNTIDVDGTCRWPLKYDYCWHMLHSEENPKVKLHSHIRLGQRAVEKHVTVSNIEYVRDGTNMTQDS